MIYIIVFAFMGFFMNRIRGGGIIDIPYNKTLNDIIFGLGCGSAAYLSGKGFIIPSISFFLMMWLGRAPGWGTYIAAIINGFSAREPEQKIIDRIVRPINNTRTWGITALSLRGMFWGLLLSIPCLSIYPLFIGSLMGPIYYLAFRIKKNYDAWGLGEMIFGSLLWGSTMIAVVA